MHRRVREREEIMNIPGDPIILLSYANTQLRDQYATLEEFCKTNEIDKRLYVKAWEVWTIIMMR